MNLPRISLMAPARALALACGLLLPATAALADEYAEVQRLQRISLLAAMMAAAAALYFGALWAAGLKLRQLLRR